jgi:hypothetical protein
MRTISLIERFAGAPDVRNGPRHRGRLLLTPVSGSAADIHRGRDDPLPLAMNVRRWAADREVNVRMRWVQRRTAPRFRYRLRSDGMIDEGASTRRRAVIAALS